MPDDAGVGLEWLGAHRPKRATVWGRDPHDFYIEPHWVSERLFQAESFRASEHIYDPACGTGRIISAARASGYNATGMDLVKRCDDAIGNSDFLASEIPMVNIATNPPFKLAEQFVRKALSMPSLTKACFLLPVTWLNGLKRSTWLEQTPLARVLVLTPRPSMPPGEIILRGQHPGSGKTDFAWYVFDVGHHGPPQLGWMRK